MEIRVFENAQEAAVAGAEIIVVVILRYGVAPLLFASPLATFIARFVSLFAGHIKAVRSTGLIIERRSTCLASGHESELLRWPAHASSVRPLHHRTYLPSSHEVSGRLPAPSIMRHGFQPSCGLL